MSGTIVIGRRSIRYTEAAEKDTNADGKMDRVSYYDGDQLLATAYDDDDDGEHDMWVTFDADLRVDQEVVDRDHDGSADVMRSLDAAGKVVAEGQAPSVETKPDPEPEPEPAKPVVVATTQPADPALPTGFPLDYRLGVGAGILVLTIFLAAMVLRRSS